MSLSREEKSRFGEYLKDRLAEIEADIPAPKSTESHQEFADRAIREAYRREAITELRLAFQMDINSTTTEE